MRKQGVRQETLRGPHYLFLSGEEMPRGDFKAMLGMSDRGATDALGALVKRGRLKSDSPQGKARPGLRQHALRFKFPQPRPENQRAQMPCHQQPSQLVFVYRSSIFVFRMAHPLKEI